jgi:catalase
MSTSLEATVLRGFSFRLGSDGQRSAILAQSVPVHFARTLDQMMKTLDQMMKFLEVRAPGPDGKRDKKKIEAFSAAYPETLPEALHRRDPSAGGLFSIMLPGTP